MIAKKALFEKLLECKVPVFRGRQIIQAVYKEGKGSYDEITVLPKAIRETMKIEAPIFPFEILKQVASSNGSTVKTLFKLRDGALVEGVLMHFNDGRNSVCVSSQVGCGLKCAFCATGTMGFIRHLTQDEIESQVLFFDQFLKKQKGSRVDHVVFMGMGEPFLNYDTVMNSVRSLNDNELLGIAARHITISTSGIIPGINKFAREPLQVNLAVSLHAPTQELREKIMPIARAYSLDALMQSLNEYVQKTNRRISYEYVMLKDVNDSPELAKKLACLVKGQKCHVNLIPYNQTQLGFKNSGKSRVDAFRDVLASFNIPVTVRVSLGQDISAACGQLVVKN